jgi:hypothetical protein
MTRCFINLHWRSVHFNVPPNFVTATRVIDRFAEFLILLLPLTSTIRVQLNADHCKYMLSDILHLLFFGLAPSGTSVPNPCGGSGPKIRDEQNADTSSILLISVPSIVKGNHKWMLGRMA